MAVSGSWNVRNNYTGAAKWGTGVNPIHSIRDNGRAEDLLTSKETLYTGAAGSVPEEIVQENWDYCDGDYYGGTEDPRYLENHPSGKSYDRSQIPANYPEWSTPGVEREEDTAWRNVTHLSPMEASTYTQSNFHQNVTGGWMSKIRSSQLQAQTSDPKQYEINTSWVQGAGVNSTANPRSAERGVDPRSNIQSRTAGMIEKHYGQSFEMGGGAGSPRMFPFQQNMLKRPFYYRSSDVPPEEAHYMNTMENRQPLTYVAPDNPYQGQNATAASDNYDYSEGDYYA